MTTREDPASSSRPSSGTPVRSFQERVAHAAQAKGDWGGVVTAEVTHALHEGGDWCDVIKAQTLVAMILGLRPRLICEVGVWTGGSFVPMLLALAAVHAIEGSDAGSGAGRSEPGRGLAIDAWSIDASCAGQEGQNLAWWGAQSHDQAKATFLSRLRQHGLEDLCDVVHRRSDDVDPPARIDLLHLDGNHGEQAVRDVERFASRVEVGGILVMDDLAWLGGHVQRARDRALEIGFRRLFPLGTGEVLQRISSSPTAVI